MSNALNIIILAAGKGTRMNSSKPKVLHEIANKEMVLHIIDLCNKIKYKNLYIILGKDNVQIKSILPKNVKIIIQKEQLGTAHALLCGEKKIGNSKEKLLILYGDVPLLEISTLRKLINKSKNNITMLGFESSHPKGYGRIKKEKNKITEVVEEKNLKGEDKGLQLCYSGIFCGPSISIYTLLSKIKKNKLQKEFLLTDIFKLAYSENFPVSLSLADEKEVMGVNNMHQLALAETYFQNEIRKKFMMKGVTLKDPKTTYFSHDTKVDSNVIIGANNTFGEGVVIKKNAFIHANNNIEKTTIHDFASVGPFCRLRGGTVIGKFAKVGNFVEIKKSIIGEYSKINHLSYIGDALVGVHCNIGAGTITCNYDGRLKHKTIIGNNVFIGSNCSLVAPIKINNEAFIAAGSTISKNVGIKDFSIARAKQEILKKGRKRFLK
ncbi:bifunctional UDP-N-acetylglucosamine diphosphorylase/glucosamine-1-phosphate N-acetyltransferase GlmU [Alphaproteobacteria bacterium]|nr:bifunctional UDP-N-acetylglucosamine diphosphorylase/glucosamine-1-phosphate N-acetyltransferase GlmU [Alphaproteobacteria bacterium]